jgi:hypothetical protein
VRRYRTNSHERSQAREPTTLPLIACSLDAAGQKQRLADWSSLLREAAQKEKTTDGVCYRFVAADALEARLRSLAAAEKECRAFLDFNVVRRIDEIEMTVTAPPNALAALHFIFPADRQRRAACFDSPGVGALATPSLHTKWSARERDIRYGQKRLSLRHSDQEDGAFMEPSGRNQRQPVANGKAPKTASTSQNRCHRLRPVAAEP